MAEPKEWPTPTTLAYDLPPMEPLRSFCTSSWATLSSSGAWTTALASVGRVEAPVPRRSYENVVYPLTAAESTYEYPGAKSQ